MDIADFLIANKDEILRVVARHGAGNVRVFGSVARGEPTDDSDVDLLVDLAPNSQSDELDQIAEELAQLLGCSRQRLNQQLQDILRANVIRQDGQCLVVTDPQRLLRLASTSP